MSVTAVGKGYPKEQRTSHLSLSLTVLLPSFNFRFLPLSCVTILAWLIRSISAPTGLQYFVTTDDENTELTSKQKYSPGSVNESYKHQAEALESQYCSSLSTTWEKSKKCTHLLWFQWLLSVDKRTSTLAVECIEFNSLEAAHSHSINSICRQRTAGVSEWQNIHVSAAAHCRNTIFVCFFFIFPDATGRNAHPYSIKVMQFIFSYKHSKRHLQILLVTQTLSVAYKRTIQSS